jgi:hypothetical protein
VLSSPEINLHILKLRFGKHPTLEGESSDTFNLKQTIAPTVPSVVIVQYARVYYWLATGCKFSYVICLCKSSTLSHFPCRVISSSGHSIKSSLHLHPLRSLTKNIHTFTYLHPPCSFYPVNLHHNGNKCLRNSFETTTPCTSPSLSFSPQIHVTDLTFCSQEIQKKPEPWYSAGLVDDSNIYEWEITIIGY